MPTQPAVLGTARLNNFRLGYLSAALFAIRETKVRILLAGEDVRVRVSSLTIEDAINDTPNRCSLVIAAPPPTGGQTLRVTINANAPRLLFNGTIQQDDLTYEGRPTQLVYPCRAIDDTAQLTRRRPFGSWVDTSATTIAQAIIATYAPGFTSTHVQAALPTLSIIFDGTDDFAVALKRLATAIGGYWYVEDLDVHLFTTEAIDAPDPIQVGYPFCDDPPIAVTTDVSQLRTRQCGKGHGEAVLVDVAAHETILPIDDAVMFNAAGGKAIAGTTPDGAQSQVLTYTGTINRSIGSTVGPSLSPSVAPVATLTLGAGLSAGVYQEAYSFVTATGETLPSPLVVFTTGPMPPPPSALVDNGESTAGSLTGGGAYSWAFTWVTAGGETTASPLLSQTLQAANHGKSLRNFPGVSEANTNPAPAAAVSLNLYRTTAGGSQLKLVTNLPLTTFVYLDQLADGALGVNIPASATAVLQQVAVSGIAVGPAGVTARNLYRTAVGGAQLKLVTTLADNTTTTYTDATADGALGANAPTSNTSGLGSSGTTGGAFLTASPVAFATNGAATAANTAAPVFTSASYSFVAADVGARVYIKAGVNWTVGFYLIVSVAGGAATLAGPCASVASPTGATWGVDYSAFTTPRVTFSDLAIDAVASTKFTSAAFPVGPHLIGNVLSVANGVGFVEQRVVVLSVSGTVATCDKVLGTLGSTGGRGTLGVAPVLPYVLAGSSTLILASAGPFPVSGGWVQIGLNVVRYSGVTANTLTGIPAPGAVGALIDTVAYGEHVYVVPALTGVTGLALPMLRGAAVHLWVERNDTAAQATQAALDAANGRVPADGIYEGPPIIDERRGEASLIALCEANLALFSAPIVTVTYATRDTKTKSGKPIVVNLTSPPIHQTLTIQGVHIDQIDIAPRLAPKFTVTASSWRTSLEDLLRRLSALMLES